MNYGSSSISRTINNNTNVRSDSIDSGINQNRASLAV